MMRVMKAWWERVRRAREMESLTDDLHEAWQERAQQPLTKNERDLLENALVFSTVTANDVCVPRADIRAVPSGSNFSKVIAAFEGSRRSRLPVYGKSMDDIVGFITLKDLMGYINRQSEFTLAATMHPPVFVPETMPVPRVLQLMRRHRVGLVVVTDEYGGTAGLLTLKDLLGELVGGLGDEHDGAMFAAGGEGIQSLGGGRFRVPAGLMLDQVAATLSIKWPRGLNPEIETIGGLLLHEARRVPKSGETVNLPGGVSAKVLAGDARKLDLLELKLPDLPRGGRAS
jgi:CBS domain containing-hemolysin-like protein